LTAAPASVSGDPHLGHLQDGLDYLDCAHATRNADPVAVSAAINEPRHSTHWLSDLRAVGVHHEASVASTESTSSCFVS
jgi:hypothetical protein